MGRWDTSECESHEDDRVGSVLKIGLDDPKGTVVVKKCRNPMYMNCLESSCYAMELSGDTWSDREEAVEKMIRIDPLSVNDVGYPFCIAKNVPNSDCNNIYNCSALTEPGNSVSKKNGFDFFF